MRQATLFITSIMMLIGMASSNGAGISGSIMGAVGIPQGYMDMSFNPSLRLQIGVPFLMDPELRIGTSISTKKKDDVRLTMAVTSIYILLRKPLFDVAPKISPYLAGGLGLHTIYSNSSGSAGLGDQSSFKALSKGHLFLGVDTNLFSQLFVNVEGRLTVPSEILIDQGYIGIGLRF